MQVSIYDIEDVAVCEVCKALVSTASYHPYDTSGANHWHSDWEDHLAWHDKEKDA